MKFGTLSFLALTVASVANAVPVTRGDFKDIHFGVEASNSGSKFDCDPIKKVDSHPHVFSVGGNEGSDLYLTLREDGSLVDQTGRGIYIDPSTGEFGNVDPWGEQTPSCGFEIKDNILIYQGTNDWKACPSGPDKYSLARNDCTGGTDIDLKVLDPHCD
ncbi:uncharacterized protein AC631_05146 [Debaryomyces fabryi]|uniref:Cell wall protein n=1 Tax=Debaryomyces fabryi TaxID=58627 RepID=A0A0V1PS86_9ASCO|nr:uncharacterized protein AC631_05146 [Debaryomyces fabryi]KRZ99094.1 hypothetical protein AC631_05146 [Debaryomyces fabryi]CUM45269.1 unnamed protein product [Debaryomyces fabryi]